MKFVLLGDLHLLWDNPGSRLDEARVTQKNKFLYVLKWAEKNNAVILQPGDFFDKPRSWYLLPEIIDILKGFQLRICGIYGQHDTYMYSAETRKNTSLGVLISSGLVEELTEDGIYWVNNEGETVFVYGCSYGKEVPIPSHSDVFNILVIHAPIGKEALYPGHEHESMNTFLRKYPDYDLIVCGDIHRRFEYSVGKRYIVNAGPVLRKTAELYNYEHKPGFYIYSTLDDNPLTWHEIPHEPAEKVLTRDHIERQDETNEMLDEFIKSIPDSNSEDNVTEESDVVFAENVWKFVKENDISQDIVDILSDVMSGRKEK